MTSTTFLQPVRRIGRELRFEFDLAIAESRLHRLWTQPRRQSPPALPELRSEDAETCAQRKAEAVLLAVRLGAVRR